MHVEKNLCDSLIGTIMNTDGKSKATNNTQFYLENLNVWPELHMVKDSNKWIKPAAEFTTSITDRQKFCSFIKSVRFPDAFASNLRKNIKNNDNNIIGLKSHDCHVLMQRFLLAGLCPFLPRHISSTIIELCNFFQQICSRTLRVEDIEKAEEYIVLVLSKMELIFPLAFFHLVMHLYEEAILEGLVQIRWMYPFERFMKTLKEYV